MNQSKKPRRSSDFVGNLRGKQSGFATAIIILIVVGIIVVVGGGFYAWQKSTKPSIALLSPNGGEIWAIGSTYTIGWTSQNIPQTDKISIHIRRVPPPPLLESVQEFDPIIFVELENTGSVNWTISDMYPVGNYIIEVISYPSLPITQSISDENDAPFRIESSSDGIADWKVYRNVYSYESDYWGYEIKYPPDWIMTEYKGVHEAKWTSPRTTTLPLREIFIETLGAFRHGGVYIDTINCTWSESQKEWFEKNPELESKTYPRPIGKERIREIEFCKMQDIGGNETGKIGGLGIRYEVFESGWDYRTALWVNYNISEDYQPSEDEFQYELDIFKKMLYTFKFIY